MKKYYKLAIIPLTLTFFLTSCKKNLLDVNPTSNLSKTVLWTKASDADLVLTGCYNTLYASSGGFATSQYDVIAWDNFSDNTFSQDNYGGGTLALTSGLNPQSGDNVNAVYVNNYKAIAYINYFLANVGKVLTDDKLKQYQGEAYFLRAFNYFWLAQLYGNVIISTDDLSTGDYTLHKAKSSRDDVMKLVESDLDKAIASLPDVSYGSGHAVKTTAQGYKVRALLFEKKFADAATLAAQVIAAGKYSLIKNYPSNFYKPDQNASTEIMFSVKYLLPTIGHQDGAGVAVPLVKWKEYQATQDLINEYETIIGKNITDPTSGFDSNNPFNNRDPRMRMSFFFSGDTKAQGWPFTGNFSVALPGQDYWIPGYYLPKKWLTPGVVDPDYPVLDDLDFVLLRYADILLMQAEAENEANGPANAYTSINLVRARVGMPTLPTGLTQSQMRDRIRHERRVEFALEGTRYFDLRRWGIATQKLNGFVRNALFPNIKTKYQDNYDFWPIPQAEIDRNAPQLVQNPGY